jgi:hypothetical protein
MGGYGSGRSGGRATVRERTEARYRRVNAEKAIGLGALVGGRMQFEFYEQTLIIEFESRLAHPENSWLRLKYGIIDYHSGQEHQVCTRPFRTDGPRHNSSGP